MNELPVCACSEFYGSHPPDCPARQKHDALAARLAKAEAYIEALEQNLNDFVDLNTMDEAIAWRAANLENDAHGK